MQRINTVLFILCLLAIAHALLRAPRKLSDAFFPQFVLAQSDPSSTTDGCTSGPPGRGLFDGGNGYVALADAPSLYQEQWVADRVCLTVEGVWRCHNVYGSDPNAPYSGENIAGPTSGNATYVSTAFGSFSSTTFVPAVPAAWFGVFFGGGGMIAVGGGVGVFTSITPIVGVFLPTTVDIKQAMSGLYVQKWSVYVYQPLTL